MFKLKIKDMKLQISELGISKEEVRQNFGDLRFRKVWEAAYNYFFLQSKLPVQLPLFDTSKYLVRLKSIVSRTKSKLKSNIVPYIGIQLSFAFYC